MSTSMLEPVITAAPGVSFRNDNDGISLKSLGRNRAASSSMPADGGVLGAASDSATPYDSDPPGGDSDRSMQVHMTDLRKVLVTVQVCGINFGASGLTGVITVALPTMARDLNLSAELYLWPVSVYTLAMASTLLLTGAVADVIGHRTMDLTGCLLMGLPMIVSGFARDGNELVALRAIQGIGMSMHLAAAVAIVASCMARGRARNIAFSCLGLSQPLGFSFGLVVGGILVDTISWRAAMYILGGLVLSLSCVGLWTLPAAHAHKHRTWSGFRHDLVSTVDWIGALIGSSFMALSSYLLAIISSDPSQIRSPSSIVILCLSAMGPPLFVWWSHQQVKHNRPALIPNALWRNRTFSSICVTIALSNGVISAMELFSSLFFQGVQNLSALQASLRILPSLVVGVTMNLTTGFIVDKVPPLPLVTISSLLCAVAPLLMALCNPSWTYWSDAFVSQLLMPISCDVLFTVGLIIVSESFPERDQALAGSVFNTAAQFGTALGLAVMQVISTVVTQNASAGQSTDQDSASADALLAGYRASFWTMFAFMVATVCLAGWGLQRAPRIGLKTE